MIFLSLLLSSFFTFVELNCENLFDTVHDSLKNDMEFLPDGSYHWTRTRYWKKVNHLSQEIIALGELNPRGDDLQNESLQNEQRAEQGMPIYNKGIDWRLPIS